MRPFFLHYICIMKKWGLLFTFFSFFIIQLHAIVPHQHHQCVSISIEDKNIEIEFFDFLAHIFETDLGENHLSLYQNETEETFLPYFSNTSSAFYLKVFPQNQSYSPFFLLGFYQSPQFKNTKNKAPPIFG